MLNKMMLQDSMKRLNSMRWGEKLPSRSFLCAQLCSFPTNLARSQSISCGQDVACFASPPSRSFILVVALVMLPSLISSCVNLTLSWCSLFLVAHFLSVSPMYANLSHLQGILYTTLVFLSPRGVFAEVVRSRTLLSALFATVNLWCFAKF